MNKLFRVLADGREMMVVAKNTKEVKDYCYKLFDYYTISIKEVSEVDIDSEFPIVYNRTEFYNV